MMIKPEYISKLELEGDFFSIVFCNEIDGDLLKFLNKRKLTKVFELSFLNKEDKIQTEQVIFKSQQGFYLYIEDKREWDEENNLKLRFKLTIYYKIEQENELRLFLPQLLKQFKKIFDLNKCI